MQSLHDAKRLAPPPTGRRLKDLIELGESRPLVEALRNHQQAPGFAYLVENYVLAACNDPTGVVVREVLEAWDQIENNPDHEGIARSIFQEFFAEGLAQAAAQGHVHTVRALLDFQTTPAFKRRSALRLADNALVSATSEGHTACVEALLPVASQNAKDGVGRTVFMVALLQWHDACARLLEPGHDPEAMDRNGFTALMIATFSGRPSDVEIALSRASVETQDPNGRDALGIAIELFQALGWDAASFAASPQWACVEKLSAAVSQARVHQALEQHKYSPFLRAFFQRELDRRAAI